MDDVGSRAGAMREEVRARTGKGSAVARVTIGVDDDLMAVLGEQGRPVKQAARELMVLELYRRHEISRGKAAALLEMRLADFLDRAGSLGIPYFNWTEEEWEAEMRAVEETVRLHQSLLNGDARVGGRLVQGVGR